jgi:hypothetical protein
MEQEIIMLSEISQTQTERYCFCHMQNLDVKKNDINVKRGFLVNNWWGGRKS